MTKAEKYINDNPDYEIFLLPNRFGNGKQLITFNYREPFRNFNQQYLAYIDNQKWLHDRHAVMDEVEEWLIENYGIIEKEDFSELNICCQNVANQNYYCKKHEKDFYAWFKDEFPKIDLEYGGVSNFDCA